MSALGVVLARQRLRVDGFTGAGIRFEPDSQLVAEVVAAIGKAEYVRRNLIHVPQPHSRGPVKCLSKSTP